MAMSCGYGSCRGGPVVRAFVDVPAHPPAASWHSRGACQPVPAARDRTRHVGGRAVSYTHLTLPTICSV
eukprot:5511832-Alexandrium_andersonii.AAC.1